MRLLNGCAILNNILNFFSAEWAVKNNPGCKIFCKIFELMIYPRRNEKKIAGLECGTGFTVYKFAGTRNNDVHFILFMRVLMILDFGFINFNGEAAVVE